MNPLQQWYEYVDRVSRPLAGSAVVAALPGCPSHAAESALPTVQDAPEGLPPELRARRYLADLTPAETLASLQWEWNESQPVAPVPELRFDWVAAPLPAIADYLPERARDRAPWDGDTGAWVREVLNWFAARERPQPPRAPQPEAAPPLVTVGESLAAPVPAASPVECTGMRLAETSEAGTRSEAPRVDLAPAGWAPAGAEEAGVAEAPISATEVRVEERETNVPPEGVAPRLPKHWELLLAIEEDRVAQHSYKVPFRETREEMVQRLLDPSLTLEETARLLGVCPTTVRRYTNRGQLNHFRTSGNQRRFRLSDILAFLETRVGEPGEPNGTNGLME